MWIRDLSAELYTLIQQHRAFNGLYSIRARFVLLIAIAMTVVDAFIAYSQLQETSSRLYERLEQQASLLAAVHAEAVADDVWNLNEAAVTRQLSLLVTHEDIVSATVREITGLFSVASMSGHAGAPGEDLVITRPIRHSSGKIIGEVEISVSDDRIEAENALLVQSQI